MITDYGLTVQATTDPKPSRLTLGFNYLAVGTSSVTPSPSQTALGAEVARTNANGGASETDSNYYDSTLNAIVSKGSLAREISFTVSYNLTEFGFFVSSSGSNCVYRQLFREDPNDPNSNPVVISVQSGDRIRVRYTVSWIVPLDALNFSVTINGVNANAKVLLTMPNAYYPYKFHPYYFPAVIEYFRPMSASYYNYDNRTPLYGLSGGTDYGISYMSRTKNVSGTTITSNITMVAGVAFTNVQTVAFYSYMSSGSVWFFLLLYAFDRPISKTDLQEMTFSLTFSWGRA
jgi:hypothetical protein